MKITNDRIPMELAEEIEYEVWWESKFHFVIGMVIGIGLTIAFFKYGN